jgi:4-amino-4-deoxy-L-arabinose transferase-like glycosyltransferase
MQDQVQPVNHRWWTRYPVKKDWAVIGVILLLATFLRFYGLNEPGLWLDEVSYTFAAQKPIIDQIINPSDTLGGYLGVDPTLSAIPFSLALKLGFSNFLARFPAALFGVLGVALIH